jgi:dTDP-4-amino-4,6-dideoxygalactose transaminase
MITPIPLTCPARRVEKPRPEIQVAFNRVLSGGNYILGPEVESFEQEYAQWADCTYCIGVANGTDAIVLTLKALDIGVGDEVITSSHSAVATAAAVRLSGATPVFADIDPVSRCICPSSIEKNLSKRTKAIIPVHIYGHPADLTQITSLSEKYGIPVIEDCAQAHGAMWKTKKVGTFGVMAAYSFYPTKNLGALGDGGAVVTNNGDLAARLRSLRQYGWETRYVSNETGMNSRLDELQAAFLRIFLRQLDSDNLRRREIARRYTQSVTCKTISPPNQHPDAHSVFHLYVIEAEKREELASFMKSRSIHTARHYPLPIHKQDAYYLDGRILPNTERLYQGILSLPMFPELTEEEILRVCAALNEWK